MLESAEKAIVEGRIQIRHWAGTPFIVTCNSVGSRKVAQDYFFIGHTTLRNLRYASSVPGNMEMSENVWEWLTQINWDWKLVIPLTVLLLGAMTLVWRILNAHRERKDRDSVRSEDRAATERQHLSGALKLVDELIHSQSPDHMLAGLSSDVPRSSKLLADKAERKQTIMRELEAVALQLPHDNYEEVAADLLCTAKSLGWDEWQAVQLRSKLARLINPKLIKNVKDNHALDDDEWKKN